jgi:hypothetical protein
MADVHNEDGNQRPVRAKHRRRAFKMLFATLVATIALLVVAGRVAAL